MQRLLEYVQHHSILVGLAVALAIAVLIYELRIQRQNYSGLQPQEAIRLMNQGAALFDLRDGEAYAAGEEMRSRTHRGTVPQIFIGATHVGGFDELKALDDAGGLDPLLAGVVRRR